jgi:hypothetical protein
MSARPSLGQYRDSSRGKLLKSPPSPASRSRDRGPAPMREPKKPKTKQKGPDPFGIRALRTECEGARLGATLSRMPSTLVPVRSAIARVNGRPGGGAAHARRLERRDARKRDRTRRGSVAGDGVSGLHDEFFAVECARGHEGGAL